MKTKAQVMGHPLHPILITFPSALYPTALIFDIVYLVTGELLWWTLAFWTLLVGVVGSLAASVPGLIDYTVIPDRHPGKATATRHMWMGLALTVVALAALFTRDFGRTTEQVAPLVPIALIALANLLLIVQGYWGGSLVYKHGIAVQPQHPEEYGGPGGISPRGGEEGGRPRPGGGKE